jgi:dihydroorotase (multifunctional complex type)
MLDLRVINGVVAAEAGVGRLDVGIEDGRIAELAEPGGLGPAREEIDATGLHVLPGAIDVHFHCRAPSHPERGDFGSETAAAVGAGVTTIFEMPISLPACSTPEVLQNRRRLAERDAFCNVALYSGAVLGGRDAVDAMVEAGAIGFKLFTISPQPGREAEFAGLWTVDEGEMLESLAAISATGLPCVVHAENEGLLRHFGAVAADPVAARPPVCEATAIATVAAIAAATDVRLHVAHVTSARALAAVRGARLAGATLSAETCPQYLSLDSRTIVAHGGVAKIGPPLREPEDSTVLWTAVADGTIDLVSSDHSPFLYHEKAGREYATAPMGLPTVELLVPVVLDGAARGIYSLERAVELLAAAPARLFGLYPEKGAIAVGADADLALVAVDRIVSPSPSTLRTKAAGCGVVFEGMSLLGAVETTVVGGAIVYAQNAIVSSPQGRFVGGRSLSALESS